MVTMSRFPAGLAHLIGVAGYGMRGLARLLLGEGRAVSGSDACEGAATDALKCAGLRWTGAAGVPRDAAFVVHSAAVADEHAELSEAHVRGLPCYKYAAALGGFCATRTVLACAGTHGKSTTTALLALLLRNAGIDAGYLIGADPPSGLDGFASNARTGDPMVIEACEYDCSFLQFRPHGAVITNVEKEHVDCFPTEAALFDAFRRFVAGIEPGGVLAVEPAVAVEVGRAAAPGVRVVTFGPGGMWYAVDRRVDADGQAARICGPHGEDIAIRLSIPGVHNLSNATAAVALGAELYGREACARGAAALRFFCGMRRRFEVIWRGCATYIDDYAHHPSEVRATLGAARERFPDARRFLVVFQPHQVTRLETFKEEFAEALGSADLTLVLPVFAARECGERRAAASTAFAGLAARRGAAVEFCADFAAAGRALRAVCGRGDVVLFLGAGDVTDFAAAMAAEARQVEDNGQES
jgi:UDP-N-acetylmuramate--alanine ligase